MTSLSSHSADQTRALGAALGKAIARRNSTETALTIALNGELGAGKTTFVGGLLRALGVTGTVRSPTYTLIEPYEISFGTVYHLDLYRLADARELEMLALRDLLQPGSVLLVEWAEKGRQELPLADLTLTLRYPKSGGYETARIIDLVAGTPVGKELASRVQSSANEADVSS